jgi:hypothetical protein
LIRDLEIPVIGPEEGAADYLATTVLIRSELFEPESGPRTTQYLLDSANGLAAAWDAHERIRDTQHYWDSHLLTIQRHFNIICLIYGSDPERFATLPARVGMSEGRTALCEGEFARAEQSLQWVLETFGRRADDPDRAGITVDYSAPSTRTTARVLDALQESGIVENTVRLLEDYFSIPNAFHIVFRACREPQARWLPDRRELVFCYELFDHYYALGRLRSVRPRDLAR